MSEEYVTGVDADYTEYMKSFKERTNTLVDKAVQSGNRTLISAAIRLNDKMIAGELDESIYKEFNTLVALVGAEGVQLDMYRTGGWTMLDLDGWLTNFRTSAHKTGVDLADALGELDEESCPALVHAVTELKELTPTTPLSNADYKRIKFMFMLIERVLDAGYGLFDLLENKHEGCEDEGEEADMVAENHGFDFMKHSPIM